MFTSPRAGGGKPRFKAHDRAAHGTRLASEFDSALPPEEEEEVAVRVEFQSEPGFDLRLKSLDSARKDGFELLAVRKAGDGDSTTTFATLLIPRTRLKHFKKIFEQYISENTKKGTPKHQVLVESIATIRRATLRSLWTDLDEAFPAGDELAWCEIWLRADGGALEAFRKIAAQLQVPTSKDHLSFIDRIVVLAKGSAAQLGHLVEEDLNIAEVRRAKVTPADFVKLPPGDQAAWAGNLAGRLSPPPANAPAVCLLDTGVNNGHILLEGAVPEADLLTCNPDWGVHDHHGHGTEMAGLALYGDLAPVLLSNELVALTHGLESVKLLPPAGQNDPEVYGALTIEAVSRAEIRSPLRPRTICMAVTATDNRDRGQPSSWSGAIDQLTSGADDGVRRLLCVSAGNVDLDAFLQYPDSNLSDSIRDPAQAWNPLTVGAVADRVDITESDFVGWQPIAPLGDMAPSSTTSFRWERRWPLKPDVVMPGGNAAVDPLHAKVDLTDSLSLLTTYWRPLERQFTSTGETSAAAAQAARLAAHIQATYPELWPEATRALLVHSARWTHPMVQRFPRISDRLRCCGFGLPDRAAALASAANAVNLISQQWIQPFDERLSKGRKSYVTREMHLHRLPWPSEVLRSLGEVEVELRVTLSYFVEPSPGRRGWKDRHRYASYGLRFDVKTATESSTEFLTRINKAARAEDEQATTASDAAEWALGPDLRSAGSIHSDIWTGAGVDLAEREHIAVYPTMGWWNKRPHLGMWNKRARYALVVSIRAPEIDIDIYTAVENQIAVGVTA